MGRLRSLYEQISAKGKKLKIKVISVGKTKEKNWRAAEAEYSKRIMRYAQLEHIQVKMRQPDQLKTP
jgi:23S rRNA pseudoU1915 N3-methylase RlmH